MGYQPKNYVEQGAERTVIGGSLDVESGGDLDIESGAALKIAGTDKTSALAATVANPLAGTSASKIVAFGAETTTGTLVVTSGLTKVESAVACLAEDAALDPLIVTVALGSDESTFTVKLWKATASNDVTPIESTETGKKFTWIAIGT